MNKHELHDKIGRRIRQARTEMGLTIYELSEAIGCVSSSVAHWESGHTGPKVYHLYDLCNTLKVSADWLIFGDEP